MMVTSQTQEGKALGTGPLLQAAWLQKLTSGPVTTLLPSSSSTDPK